MGRRRDPRRREQLLDAVAGYILRFGLAELSLRPLAAELRTSPRMLLYHFGSKENLLVEALGHIRRWQQQQAADWFDQEPELEPARLLERAWEWFSSKEAEPFMRLFFEIYGLALQEPARYQGFLEHAVADWMPLAETTVQRAGIATGELEQRATLLVATHRGLLLDLLTAKDRKRVDASHARFVADLTRASVPA
jgi:AcrR family transcriptional regulator